MKDIEHNRTGCETEGLDGQLLDVRDRRRTIFGTEAERWMFLVRDGTEVSELVKVFTAVPLRSGIKLDVTQRRELWCHDMMRTTCLQTGFHSAV